MDIKAKLVELKAKRAELLAERDAIVQTYTEQLTALEQQRKELVAQCPHTNMSYGIFNQCGDCEEWF